MSEQSTLLDYPHNPPSRDQDEGNTQDKKDDPSDPNNEILAYGETYETNKSKDELKKEIMNYIENNKPVYYDGILEKFNTNDFVLLEVMGELHQEEELHGYRKNEESLITTVEPKKDADGNVVSYRPVEDTVEEENYLKEPDPEPKPRTTKDKDPRDLELSKDEERLISIIRGLLRKNGSEWVSWHDVYSNMPENWIIHRLQPTLVELIRYGILEVKGISSKEYTLKLDRLKEIRGSSSLSFNSEGGDPR